MSIILFALIATTFTWGITALGAGTVVFFNGNNDKLYKLMLGFASGVMISASFWSLLLPSIEKGEEIFGNFGGVFSTLGFIIGGIFLYLINKTINCFEKNRDVTKQSKNKQLLMMIISITIHNIPEGLAVGVAFGSLKDNFSQAELISAIMLAVGIGIQNFPEGAAVSIPLRTFGYSKSKSFLIGQASALVEPVFGVLGAILVSLFEIVLPISLSFAAGCMIYVVSKELISECNRDFNENYPTMAIIFGFSVMMVLDIMV